MVFFQNENDIIYGLPQGSVLGPLIFTLYTLPICAILDHHKVDYHMYADDTQIYCSFDDSSVNDVLKRLMSCISDIRSWMIQNKLKINDDKTEFLILSSPRSHISLTPSLQIGDVLIESSVSCRNLGA